MRACQEISFDTCFIIFFFNIDKVKTFIIYAKLHCIFQWLNIS